ncbi:MAG: single-stranded DNA-binding protein [Candidatus Chloroheliales bacterium]|nr:MAG: single-stranded DNA-binding protein [Chloroflexota bacterium]
MSSRSLNKVQLIGHLGASPELKYTQSGRAVATVNLATNNRYRDQQGNLVENTEWHRVTFWERNAETVSQYLAIGSLIYVEGRLHYRQYEVEGQKRTAVEIVARDYLMLDSRHDVGQAGAGEQPHPSSSYEEEYNPDEDFAY